MWPMAVVVVRVLAENGGGVPLVDDEDLVEELAADGADEPFGDRVGPRRPHRCPDDADVGGGEDGVERVTVHAWTGVVADAFRGLHRSAAGVTELAARAAELLDTQLTPVRDRHPGVVVERHVVNDTALSALLDQAREARTVGGRAPQRGSRHQQAGFHQPGSGGVAPCPVVVA